MAPSFLSGIRQWRSEKPTGNPQLIHAPTLLKAVGIFGMGMPWLMIGGSWLLGSAAIFQDSISDYYHSGVRDLFVGILCAIALFLSAYRGYDHRDRLASLLACGFALGIAFFPTAPAFPDSRAILIGHLHLVFAASFFIVLTIFAIYLFRSYDAREGMTTEKICRNRVYLVCGLLMIFCLVGIGVYMLILQGRWEGLDGLRPVLVFESMALSAFGFSWLVKGGFILRDRPS